VKQLMKALPTAYQSGDTRRVKRMVGLLEFSRGEAPDQIASKQGVAVSTIYHWRKPLLSAGLTSVKAHWRGGGPAKLTGKPRQALSQWLKAGPQAAGDPTGCWSARWVQELIQGEFGVLYNPHDLAEVLKGLGFCYPQAGWVSFQLDEVKRWLWLTEVLPLFQRQAQAAGGWLRLGAEASLAQWGSLGYSWAPLGQPPTVPSRGQRRADPVFGLIDCFSRRRFFQGVEGQFKAASSIGFLRGVLDQTSQPLFRVQAGAQSHSAQAVGTCFAQYASRLTLTRLPSDWPDYNPIELLWRAVKRRTTPNVYFPDFPLLIHSVEDALVAFQTRPEYVKSRFTLYFEEMTQATQITAQLAASSRTFSERL
jgi:transposase